MAAGLRVWPDRMGWAGGGQEENGRAAAAVFPIIAVFTLHKLHTLQLHIIRSRLLLFYHMGWRFFWRAKPDGKQRF